LLQKTLAAMPKDHERKSSLLGRLGRAFMLDGHYREAVEAFSESLKGVEPAGEALALYYWLGESYCRLGRLEDCKEVLTKVAQTDDPFWSTLALDRLAVSEASAQIAAQREEEVVLR